MLYQLASEPPEPGTLLESVFLILTKMGQEEKFLQSRLMVEAILRPMAEGSQGLQDAYRDYQDAIFPFLARGREDEKEKMRNAAKSWSAQGPLRVRPLQTGRDAKRFKSRMKQELNKPRIPGRSR
jgi:hypothetical protein